MYNKKGKNREKSKIIKKFSLLLFLKLIKIKKILFTLIQNIFVFSFLFNKYKKFDKNEIIIKTFLL